MQNRSALWVFTILLAVACLWQLSFSVFTNRFEAKAAKEANFMADSVLAIGGSGSLDRDSVVLAMENKYLRDHNDDVIYPVTGYTYKECKEREINQGLDLKGGMAVTLEVSIPELVVNLAGNSKDEAFQKAIADARALQRSRNDDFITLFDESFRKAAPNGSLAAIFSSQDNAAMFPRESTNEQVVAALRNQAQIALNNTEKILRTRIDKFGVAQPSIQKLALSGRIQIELPGVKDKERVRKFLQSTANLEFYETFNMKDMAEQFNEANTKAAALLFPEMARRDSMRMDSIKLATATVDSLKSSIMANTAMDSLGRKAMVDSLVAADSTRAADNPVDSLAAQAEQEKRSPLFGPGRIMGNPYAGNGQQHVDVIGYCRPSDTARVNVLLARTGMRSPDPSFGMKLAWDSKPMQVDYTVNPGKYLALRALKVPRDGKPRIDGAYIIDASQDFDPMKGDPVVSMQMNQEGALIWKQMTEENVGKNIAVTLDGLVASSPTIIEPIPNGSSRITLGSGDKGKMLEEATDLANILKAGALPAPARIIDETVVGPSLGAENIRQGLISFAVAMLLVMIFMVVYYNGSGWIANIALIANVFVLLGTLASLQASLTLPGIAGIVLTVGMAVDANVLINERIREELRHGKALKTAIDLGYKHAMSAIIDANVTHLMAAIILIIFGTGPIKSFGVTLALGIITSLFTAIFISRLIITRRLEKGKSLTFWHSWNKDIFAHANYNFMGRRKVFYAVSSVIIIAGFISMFTNGFNQGVDFSGGRQYVVKFDKPMEAEEVKASLEEVFEENGVASGVGVKTYGGSSQLMITTNYMVNSTEVSTDKLVEDKLHEGLAPLSTDHHIIASRKVDPTISDDIRTSAWWAVGMALFCIFIYIAIRFRTWQFGLGALLSLAHDALIVVGLYSLLWKIMPFPLEIDENFIAAILTVIGYSINDTVVVFDRIREYLQDHKREPWAVVFNKAINSTLGRTINTSVTVLLVLLVIFLLGGITIKGFVFAMLVGIAVGTYSSIFIASAVVVDLHKDTVPEGAPAKAALAS